MCRNMLGAVVPDFRVFPKAKMAEVIMRYIMDQDAASEDLRTILMTLPLLPSEERAVLASADPKQLLDHAVSVWNMYVTSWDDPDVLDVNVKSATTMCNGAGKRRGDCHRIEVLQMYNQLFDPNLTMEQLVRRIDLVAEMRATPSYRGPTFAPDLPGRRPGALAPIRARGQPMNTRHELIGRDFPGTRRRALQPMKGDALHGLMAKVKDDVLAVGIVGHNNFTHTAHGGAGKLTQAWLDKQEALDKLECDFIVRSANALTIEQPITIDGNELFIKVATLYDPTDVYVRDDPVRDAFSSVIMSDIIDRGSQWTAEFVGVRACYALDTLNTHGDDVPKVFDKEWWVEDKPPEPRPRGPVKATWANKLKAGPAPVPEPVEPYAPTWANDPAFQKKHQAEDDERKKFEPWWQKGRRAAAAEQDAEDNSAQFLAEAAERERKRNDKKPEARWVQQLKARNQQQNADNSAKYLAEAAAQERALKKGGAGVVKRAFGFKQDARHFTHLALVYRNVRGQTVEDALKAGDTVSNHSVIEVLQRIINAGSNHGMTHNDLHYGNVMRGPGGLRVIDYGRVVYRDLTAVEGNKQVMDDLRLLQSQAIKVSGIEMRSNSSEGVKKAASIGDYDVFSGLDVPKGFTWIPDLMTCTMWIHEAMQGRLLAKRQRADFEFFASVSALPSGVKVAAGLLKNAVRKLDSRLRFLAPGMALYGMTMYYQSALRNYDEFEDDDSDSFHMDKTLTGDGGKRWEKIIELVLSSDEEAVEMFKVVRDAMDENGLICYDDVFSNIKSGGGFDWPDGPDPDLSKTDLVMLDELDGVFAETMIENADKRAALEKSFEEIGQTLSPGLKSAPVSAPEPVAQVAKAPLPTKAQQYSYPSAATDLVKRPFPAAAGFPDSFQNAWTFADANLGGDELDMANTVKIGTFYETPAGGGSSSLLAQAALACVVFGAAVFGSMSS